MMKQLSIALAQLNPTVGDITGNVSLILKARSMAFKLGADLMVCGELILSGYPPEDLVLKESYQTQIHKSAHMLAEKTNDGGPAMIIGTPWVIEDRLYNALLVMDAGKITNVRLKRELPNYGVFDEKRVFSSGPLSGPVQVRGVRVGLMICEDMWFPDLSECLEESGAEILIVANGSPFETDKLEERLSYAVARIVESHLPLIYVNLVGGQDELVFDGGSFVLDHKCNLRARAPVWKESILMTTWQKLNSGWTCASTEINPTLELNQSSYQAMVLGLRDYVQKNKFPGIVLGLSGGIDSALSAAVAADAIGPDKVLCLMMPSPYTSKDSKDDAIACANILGIELIEIPITTLINTFNNSLKLLFKDLNTDTTEENIQSRARGVLLMAASNKMGYMVLTTGNKSEMSVGYTTLYGDMCGGYSVLKDIYKTDIFKICLWRNENIPNDCFGPKGCVIPSRIISKAPSAELKHNQSDQDTLPPYEILDGILKCLIEGELSVNEIVNLGFDESTVRHVWQMLDLAEYKRRQAPPGVKITRRAFGRDRRYPITNSFRDQI